ncbi:MAG: hypothetical protein OEU26_01400 [Candidatus Tectomicrobia bacterium]|nr:hypothetical protein [Candidatus Tectomicrobia bacterium]
MKPVILRTLTGGFAILILLISCSDAGAKPDKNRIAYWRSKYQQLKPQDDPRVVKAQSIFQRIVKVAGARPSVVPRLFMTKNDPWGITLPIALPDGWIVLSQKVLDIGYRDPEQGDHRLAFVLAHEVAHQLNDDFWHMRFFQALEAASTNQTVSQAFLNDVRRGASMTEHVLSRELQADERGIIYTAMAGFNTHAIVTSDNTVNFFADWIRALNPRRVRGIAQGQMRPTPQERAASLKTRLHRIVDQTAVFQVGLWWYYAGDYPKAIQAFEHFRGLFPGREVIHNLAASHHQLALQILQATQKNTPIIPFQLSMAIDPETHASKIYLDAKVHASRGSSDLAHAMALFREHLDNAIALYREALSLEPGYTPSARNLGSALIIRGVHAADSSRQADLAESVMTLSRALERKPDDPSLLNNLGVAFFYEGRRDRAETSLQKSMNQALTAVPIRAASVYNLGHIARIKNDQMAARQYQHQYEQFTSSPVPQPVTTGQTLESLQELVVGKIISSQRQIQTKSEFQLEGITYILASDPSGLKTLTQDGEVLMIMAGKGYSGKSTQGIALGSQSRDVEASYGLPSRRLATTQGQNLSYDTRGIAFQLHEGKVVSWLLF